jgi:hypothetical protein
VSDAGTVTLPLVDAFHEGRRFRPSIDPFRSNVAGFVPITAIGAVPFLVTAGLLGSVIRSRPSEPGPLPRHVVGRLRIITGFGLPFMVMADGVTLGLGFMTRPASQA